jgi:hypothetical protein
MPARRGMENRQEGVSSSMPCNMRERLAMNDSLAIKISIIKKRIEAKAF